MTAPNELEQRRMQSLLQGDHPSMSVLRAQWSVATAKSREFSGAGFFANFSIPATTPNLGQNINFEIGDVSGRSEEHTSELQSRLHLVCRLLLEKKKQKRQ